MPCGYSHGKPYRNTPSAKLSECSPDTVLPIIELRRLPKVDHNDVEAIEKRIDDYFEFCMARGLRPGVALLATALGVTENTLHDWQRKGGRRGEAIDLAKQQINSILEQLAMFNEVNPTTVIWFQKNHAGYTDTVTIETRPNTGLDALPTKDEIAKRLPKADDNFIDVQEGEYKEITDEDETEDESEEDEGEDDDGAEGED